MPVPFHKQPIPAVALALVVGYVAHKANANAAAPLGIPVALAGSAVGLMLVLGAALTRSG